jgi:hypothetical protein
MNPNPTMLTIIKPIEGRMNMSLTCQFEQVTSSYTPGELSREMVIETKLKIPETVPKIDTVIGGSIQIGAPVVSVNDDGLLISGIIYPQLFYAGSELNELSGHHHRPEYNGSSDDQGQPADNEYTQREPKEHSYIWSGENGLTYEERVEIPDWKADNAAEVKIIPKSCDFERNGIDRINFSARVVILIQPTSQKQETIITGLTVQPHEKITVTKEQVTTEQLEGIKQAVVPVQASLLLPVLKPGISRVLNCGAHAHNLSWEYNRGKVYLKGLLNIDLVYVGLDDDDQPTDIMANEWNQDSGNPIPFETHFDTEIPEENILVVPDAAALNTNVTIKSRREIQCQVNLDCKAAISRIHSLEIVTEAAPNPGALIDTQKTLLNFEEYLGEASGEISFEFTTDLPAGHPGAERLLTCQGQFMEPKAEITEGAATIEGNLNLWLLYSADGLNGPELHTARWEPRYNNQLPVAGMVDFPNLQPDSLLRIQTALEPLKTELLNERSLKISGRIKARLLARAPRTLSILEDCAEVIPVNPETRPSMLFYIVQPGDTLWKIARRYQTTVAQLTQSNQISNLDQIEAGRKLLIPKQTAG